MLIIDDIERKTLTRDEAVVCKEAIDDILAGTMGIDIAKDGDAKFPYERSVVIKLLREWARANKKVLREIDKFASTSSWPDVGGEKISNLLASIEAELGESFGALVQEDVSGYLNKSYQKGKRSILGPKKLPFAMIGIDLDAIKWLQDHHLYWIRNFYSRRLSKGVSGIVTEGMAQGLGRVDIGNMLKEAFETYKGLGVQPDAYWRGLSANAMSRSRNFGQIQGFVDAEIKQLEIVATIDSRTSNICREMNGKIINVSAAVRQRDALMSALNPEDVATIAPWRSAEEAAGMSADQVGMPPYHFHCRSRVVER